MSDKKSKLIENPVFICQADNLILFDGAKIRWEEKNPFKDTVSINEAIIHVKAIDTIELEITDSTRNKKEIYNVKKVGDKYFKRIVLSNKRSKLRTCFSHQNLEILENKKFKSGMYFYRLKPNNDDYTSRVATGNVRQHADVNLVKTSIFKLKSRKDLLIHDEKVYFKDTLNKANAIDVYIGNNSKFCRILIHPDCCGQYDLFNFMFNNLYKSSTNIYKYVPKYVYNAIIRFIQHISGNVSAYLTQEQTNIICLLQAIGFKIVNKFKNPNSSNTVYVLHYLKNENPNPKSFKEYKNFLETYKWDDFK